MEMLCICYWAAQKQSGENDAWSGDLVAAGSIYLQVGEGF